MTVLISSVASLIFRLGISSTMVCNLFSVYSSRTFVDDIFEFKFQRKDPPPIMALTRIPVITASECFSHQFRSFASFGFSIRWTIISTKTDTLEDFHDCRFLTIWFIKTTKNCFQSVSHLILSLFVIFSQHPMPASSALRSSDC